MGQHNVFHFSHHVSRKTLPIKPKKPDPSDDDPPPMAKPHFPHDADEDDIYAARLSLPQWPSLTSRMTPTKTTFTPHVFPSPTSSSSSSLSFPSPNPRHDLTRDVPFSSLSPLSLLLLFPPFPISINPKSPVPAYPSNIHPILPLLLNPLLSFLPTP